MEGRGGLPARVGPGTAERSWGVHVAKLAGVPRAVLAPRRRRCSTSLEDRARGPRPAVRRAAALRARPGRPGTRSAWQHPVLEALTALDPDTLSPREAQEALYRLSSLMDGAVNGDELG